jgi:hypothetical protein
MRSRAHPPSLLLPAAAATGVALLAACAAPPPDAPRSPRRTAQALLALDLAPRRAAAIDRVPARLAAEAGRVPELARTPAAIAGDEGRRVRTAVASGETVAANELDRRPAPQRLLPSAHRVGQDVADDLVLAAQLTAGARRPLGEIDDREHRTDPGDARPERTWWQRVRRRLWLSPAGDGAR